MKSVFLKLNQSEWLKGFYTAIAGSILASAYDIATSLLNTGAVSIDWKHLLAGTLIAGLAYLKTTLLSNSEGKPLTAEPKMDTNIPQL